MKIKIKEKTKDLSNKISEAIGQSAGTAIGRASRAVSDRMNAVDVEKRKRYVALIFVAGLLFLVLTFFVEGSVFSRKSVRHADVVSDSLLSVPDATDGGGREDELRFK